MADKVFSIILKEKKLIILSVLASFVLFIGYAAFLYKPFYKTEAKVFIRNVPQYNISSDTETSDTIIASQSGYSNPLFNMVQVLQSESLSGKIYNNVKKNYPNYFKTLNIDSPREFYTYYKNKIKIKIIPSTDTLALSLKWADKKTAEYLLMETIFQFKNQNLEIRKSVETKQSDYIDNYLKEIESKLSFVRKQIRDYRLANSVINAEDESGYLIQTKYNMEETIANLKSQIYYNDKKLANYSRQLGFKDARIALRATAIGQDQYLVTLQNELASARQKYANLTGKFNDNYPEVIAVKNEIDSLNTSIGFRNKESLQEVSVKRGLYDKPSQDIAIEMAKTQAETHSLRAQLKSLLSSLYSLKSTESQLPNKILSFDELQKQEETLKNIYENVKRKQLEARFKENEIVDNVFVLDYPSKPKRENSDLMASFLGFIYAGALAGFLGGWIKEKPEMKTKGLYKPIGVLPYIEPEHYEVEYDKTGLARSTESVHGASYASIAANLTKIAEEKGTKIISFASSSPFRNSSFITPNIASHLARLGKSVVLISGDFKCSNKIREQFKAQSQSNNDFIDVVRSINYEISTFKYITSKYMNLLFEKNSLKINVDELNGNHFYILPIINEVNNLYDYVLSSGFDEFLNFLKARCDFVLIDIPAQPITYPVCSSLMQKTDLNIMIADSSFSPESISATIDELKDFNLDIPYVISRDAKSRNYLAQENQDLYLDNVNT